MKTNSMYFDTLDEALKFVKSLCEIDLDNMERYNDIHMHIDEEAFIVEWVQVPYSGDYGGKFEYIDEDQTVMTDFILPDNSYVQFETQDEFNDYLDEWLEENPGWVRTPYGTWTNEIENKKFREELEKESK